ncbi:hypothetical protein ACFQFQ_16735 [Sulfitobacter porphyrae]|uniref:Uncharacterized protein n=1 Tax=Sulfitobacter porphyrae TaxID=1246864 RepID=A0ABW2B6D2_9RHOB
MEEGDTVAIGAQVGMDTPDSYYLRQWGGLEMGGAAPASAMFRAMKPPARYRAETKFCSEMPFQEER